MSWFRRMIGRVVRNGVEQAVTEFVDSPQFREMVEAADRESLSKLPMDRRLTSTGFIRCMALRFWEAGHRDWVACKQVASRCLREYLADEKINYGDRRYAWDRSGAVEVAESEIEHWEAA